MAPRGKLLSSYLVGPWLLIGRLNVELLVGGGEEGADIEPFP